MQVTIEINQGQRDIMAWGFACAAGKAWIKVEDAKQAGDKAEYDAALKDYQGICAARDAVLWQIDEQIR